jgi:CheY-like chemotaxis protein
LRGIRRDRFVGNPVYLRVHERRERKVDRKKVLVVEDEQDIAELLILHLGDIDCDATLAADGHEAMRLAFARNWDLVILDLRLPGLTGWTSAASCARESPLRADPDADRTRSPSSTACSAWNSAPTTT